jgi:hypothetical protein
VLEATMGVVEAALDSGARAVELKIEAQGDSRRFGGGRLEPPTGAGRE